MTIKIKTSELTLNASDKTLLCVKYTKAIEQHFHVVLFIMLHKVVLAFKSVDETLVCDHLNESY